MLSGVTLSASEIAGTAVFRIVVSSDSMKNATATSHGSSRLPSSPLIRHVAAPSGFRRSAVLATRLSPKGSSSASSPGRKRGINHLLRLLQDRLQMRIVLEALRVDLVDV